METIDLYEKREILQNHLDQLTNSLWNKGKEAVKKRNEYYRIRSSQIDELVAMGHKSTYIREVIDGLETVNNARMIKELAENDLEFTKEAINTCKYSIKFIDSEIEREWNACK